MTTKPNIDTLFTGSNAAFIDSQFERYYADKSSVDEDWRAFFARMEGGIRGTRHPSWQRSDWPPISEAHPKEKIITEKPAPLTREEIRKATLDSVRALMMIRSYRVRGHLVANLDPLGLEERPSHPELQPGSYGFTGADLDRPIFIDNVLGLEMATVREILEILHRTYCSSVGVEFMHISGPEEKAWIQKRIEGRDQEIHFTNKGKLAILQKLMEAEQFEKFLGRKFIGTKRFGLDGAEAIIPALEAVIKTGGQLGVKEIVIGMAHRGRLNVLVNVMQKPYQAIFHEFHGGSSKPDEIQGSGDVKYHLGTSANREFDGNPVHLSLTANPSHLEAVDPVVLGKTRAKQTQRGDAERSEVLSLLIHGDAAFAGQGIVAECFMLSGLKGYRTGGTVHFIINNQIGFTTHPHHSRSSPYPSDSAKIVQAPIFHVNGDDPEAVVFVTKLATEFRQKFKNDVVIDMVCYRRFGHNESDEPSFTQPKMYARIRDHASTPGIYLERLKGQGLITVEGYQEIKEDFTNILEKNLKATASYKPERADRLEGRWEGFLAPPGEKLGFVKTGVAEETLKKIGRALTTVPKNLSIHKTLARVLAAKQKTLEAGKNIDWTTAEALAFGSLLLDGFGVRLAGQDSIRGTFSQRHAEFVNQVTEEGYNPLASLKTEKVFEVIDSPLSETGVLGFEYGYSQAEPMTLVLWEAQFGDFANVAQVVVDQFISSAEAKWLRSSGLVMLLPHGYEGQGPEHSSARLERYLQMCAENNMQVVHCSTPANYFHLLRRQMHRKFRKPLIVMTPKSLLRNKLAVSTFRDMGPGTGFLHVIGDGGTRAADKDIRRVIVCSGKVYYDLLEAREARKAMDTAIIRLEQLYPFPDVYLAKELGRYPGMEKLLWCQEEPKNMGAWSFAEPRVEEILKGLDGKGPARALYAGRKQSAAAATGLASVHQKEQAALVDKAFSL
ncbi:MAG: 2-oxoglutarate dehydrogenase E1 component [Proteobacteria bacterium]|nr:2-oxoglutarate dehydrogenase E1 component [Pseudomonadota bacterium]